MWNVCRGKECVRGWGFAVKYSISRVGVGRGGERREGVKDLR